MAQIDFTQDEIRVLVHLTNANPEHRGIELKLRQHLQPENEAKGTSPERDTAAMTVEPGTGDKWHDKP